MRGDEGSTIPLVLGFLMLALLLVAGSVAAGDAYVQQSNLQSACDAAAVAAAADVDSDAQRASTDTTALQLANVQADVRGFLDRDADRSKIDANATIAADGATVMVLCQEREPVAFGVLFGAGAGIVHRATASARSPQSF